MDTTNNELCNMVMQTSSYINSMVESAEFLISVSDARVTIDKETLESMMRLIKLQDKTVRRMVSYILEVDDLIEELVKK